MTGGDGAAARDAFFSSVARLYDLNLAINGYHLAVARLLRRLPLARSAPLRALDAGCGTGLYAFGILKRFPHARVTAFDFNAAMVEQARLTATKRRLLGRLDILAGDITDPALPLAGPFDLIVTGGVLEYVDIHAAVANMARFLAPGGFFLNAPVKDNALGRLIGRSCHYTPLSRGANIAAFGAQGFVLRERMALPPYTPIAAVKEAHLFERARGG